MNSLIINYALCIAISCGLSCFIYKILYSICECTNLTELVVGSTVFVNYNKNIDYLIYGIYIAIFFVCFLILKKVLPSFEIKDKIKDFKLPVREGNPQILQVLQTLSTFMYFLLYPSKNLTEYPILLFIVLFLIVLANADIYFKIIFKDKKVSPLAIIPLLLLVFGHSYNFGTVNIDDYHFGEKFGTYFLTHFQGMKVFQDINLIHGYNDIFSGFIANKIFGEYTIYSFLLAETLIYNLNLILSLFLGFLIFSKNPIFITGILVNSFYYFNVYFLIALGFLKKEALNAKDVIWLQWYIVACFILTAFWFQAGIFFAMGLLPVALYKLYQLIKRKNAFKLLYLAVTYAFFKVIFKDFISGAYNYHLISDVMSYANGFPVFKYTEIWSNFIKLFALLAVPCFVIEGIKAYKNKNLQLFFVYTFATLFAIVASVYALTRIDYIMFSRIRYISIAYITILLPFIFTITKSVWLKYTKYVFTALLIVLIAVNFNGKWDNSVQGRDFELNKIQKQNIEDMKNFVDKYSRKDDYILDLTNRGLNYFYLQRKAPYNMISYFNFTSEKEEDVALKQIKQNPPKIIILKSDNIVHDEIYPMIRINKIVKWILTNNYELVQDKGLVYFVKTDKDLKYSYSKKDLQILDEILGNKDLKQLPQSWANNIENVGLKKISENVYEDTFKGKMQLVKFGSPVTDNFEIKMKGSTSTLKFNTNNATAVLIPLEIYPSWYLKPSKIIIEK